MGQKAKYPEGSPDLGNSNLQCRLQPGKTRFNLAVNCDLLSEPWTEGVQDRHAASDVEPAGREIRLPLYRRRLRREMGWMNPTSEFKAAYKEEPVWSTC